MSDERLDLIRRGCARARVRMAVETPWHLLYWLEETLAEMEKWRPRQARLMDEEAA